jgi:hypothetical protein
MDHQLAFKAQLKAASIAILKERIAAAQMAMNAAQDAANSEDKSSAGDKYETSRAMGQLDRDMFARQWADAQHEMDLVNSLNVDTLYPTPCFGAIVKCNMATFYISRGLGTIDVDGHKVILLSPLAPVAINLQNKQPGDTFLLNGKTIEVLEVF